MLPLVRTVFYFGIVWSSAAFIYADIGQIAIGLLMIGLGWLGIVALRRPHPRSGR